MPKKPRDQSTQQEDSTDQGPMKKRRLTASRDLRNLAEGLLEMSHSAKRGEALSQIKKLPPERHIDAMKAAGIGTPGSSKYNARSIVQKKLTVITTPELSDDEPETAPPKAVSADLSAFGI